MRNSCDACAIGVMLKKYVFGEGCESGGGEMRLECARRIQWLDAVEEEGLVRRCGAQAKDEWMEWCCWWCCSCSDRQAGCWSCISSSWWPVLVWTCCVVSKPSPCGPFPSRRRAGCALQRLPALGLAAATNQHRPGQTRREVCAGTVYGTSNIRAQLLHVPDPRHCFPGDDMRAPLDSDHTFEHSKVNTALAGGWTT